MWASATLESICTRVSSGGTPSRKNAEYFSSDATGHLWVKSKELLDCAIEDTEEQITDSGLQFSSAKYLPAYTVLVAMYGANVGQLAWLRNPATVNQAICGLVVDECKADWRFVFYSLLMNRGDLTVQAHGAAQQNLNQDLIRQFAISLPPLSLQRRIADIMSAYDELIENNQRRIKILESMARAIYREWFVHFRFPGHEMHPRVASPLGEIPQEWNVTELKMVCADGKGIQTGPFGSQLHEADYSDEGVPVVMPKDLIGFRIRPDSIARIPEVTADKLSRHRMQPGDIVYGRRGDIGRRAFLMAHQAGWFCGTGCLRVRANPQKINGWYLFNYLGQENVVGLIKGRAQGVTMPNLNTGLLSSVPVALPPRQLQDEFARITFPMAETIEALFTTIQNLRRTRDLLLPRLLSGQIDVSTKDHDA